MSKVKLKAKMDQYLGIRFRSYRIAETYCRNWQSELRWYGDCFDAQEKEIIIQLIELNDKLKDLLDRRVEG